MTTTFSRRSWTPAEDALLAARYRTAGAAALAAELGRTPTCVSQQARKLGLAARQLRRIVWTAAVEARFRDLHAAGWCDARIARDLGCCRARVRYRRRALGLASNRASAFERRACGEKYAALLERLGVANLNVFRARQTAELAASYGLPPDLRGRHVEIVVLLAAGPLSKRQIVQALGLKWLDQQKSLHSDEAGGNYLSDLSRRGLVVRMHVRRCGGRERVTGDQYLYALTPHAMDLLAKGGPPCPAP